VIPVLGGHQIADVFGLGGEYEFLEFRNGLATDDKAQLAAILGGPGVLRVLFGEFREITAGGAAYTFDTSGNMKALSQA
jgi:hypothetical protein